MSGLRHRRRAWPSHGRPQPRAGAGSGARLSAPEPASGAVPDLAGVRPDAGTLPPGHGPGLGRGGAAVQRKRLIPAIGNAPGRAGARAGARALALVRAVIRGLARGAAAVLLALSLPVGAQAQTVLVLSGEHAGFTRLALVLPAPGGWTIEPTDGGYALLLEPPDIVLDMSRVFDLIRRDRIAAVAPRPGGMFLGVTCDCHLRSFEDRPGVLVIDVVSGPEPVQVAPTGLATQPPATRPLPALASDTPPQGAAGGGAALAGALPGTAAARTTVPPRPAPPASGDPGLGAAQTWLAARAPDTRAAGAQPTAADPATDAARAALIAQISRAASQDMLQIAAPPGPSALDAPVIATASPDDAAQQGALGISVGTVFDRDAPGRDQPALTGRGAVCPTDAQLALGEWVGTTAPTVALADARRALLGEFDQPRPEAVLRLVHVYLALGFGAEARATMAAFDDITLPDRALLDTVAAVIDDMPAPPGPLAGLEDCDTAAALWALLAQPEAEVAQTIDAAAVVRAFSALPPALRQTVGARLAGRLVAAGLDGSARSIAATLARTPSAPGGALDLIEARLELPQDPDAAAARLATLAAGNGPDSTEALILLVEADLARGAAVAPTVLETLAAQAFELRGTAIGHRVEMAQALALGSAGQFDAAFAVARGLAVPSGEAALTSTLLHPLLAMLAASADDAAFLRHSLATPAWQDPRAPAALRQAIARRLLDLGLPDAALAALADRPRMPPAERLLRAEALLETGDPASALPLLAGLDEDAASGATASRARALAALGDTAAALASLRAAGDIAAAASLAWRSGDPVLIAEYGTDLQRGLATPAGAGIGAEAGGDILPGPLARGHALISDSADLRGSIDRLLATLPTP